MEKIDLVKWARKEDEVRHEDLKTVKSAQDLKTIQANAKQRRRAIGLSAGQAVKLVVLAQKAEKQGWSDEEMAKRL